MRLAVRARSAADFGQRAQAADAHLQQRVLARLGGEGSLEERRQWLPAVPAPPVFSSGTRSSSTLPRSLTESPVKPIPAAASTPNEPE